MVGSNGLRLDGSPGIEAVDRLRSDLMAALVAGGETRVDTSRLTAAGFGLVQTLFAAQIEAQLRKARLVVAAPAGGALSGAFEHLGLHDAVPLRPSIENEEWVGLVATGDSV